MKNLIIAILFLTQISYIEASENAVNKAADKFSAKIEQIIQSNDVEAKVWKLELNKFKEQIKGVSENEMVEMAVDMYDDLTHFSENTRKIEFLLKEALSRKPNMIEALFNLSVFYYRMREIDKSEQYLKKLWSINPEYPDAIAFKGVLSMYQGNKTEAIRFFKKALKLDKYNPIANIQLSNNALNSSQYDSAIKRARIALLVDSDNVNSYINIALSYYKMKKYNLAKIVCTNALTINKTAFPIYNIIGLLDLKKDKIKQAVTNFETALIYNPNFVQARLNLAGIMLNFNDFKGAQLHLKRALKIEPENINAIISLGVALRGLGKFKKSLYQYNSALKKEPNNIKALYNKLVLLQEYINNYEEALSVAKKLKTLINRQHPKYKEVTQRINGLVATIKVLKKTDKDNKKIKNKK